MSLMILHNQVNLIASLNIGSYNGTMSLAIYFNDNLIKNYDKFDCANIDLDIKIWLPGQLRFVIGNKNSNKDTAIDNHGNIIADKFIELKKFKVGLLEVPSYNLRTLCNYVKETGELCNDNFWAYNGEVTIDFNVQNVVEWHLRSFVPTSSN